MKLCCGKWFSAVAVLYCREYKKGFIVFPSHKRTIKDLVLSETLKPAMKPSWEVRGPAGPTKCIVTVYIILPPLHGWPSDMQGDLYIHVLSADDQFLSTQCHCYLVLWHSCSYCIIIFCLISFISFFFLLCQRVSWNFLGCLPASFLTRSFGLLELFSISPLSVFGCLSKGSASCLAIMRTIWSAWTQAWRSALSSLSSERLLLPPAWLFQEPSDLMD